MELGADLESTRSNFSNLKQEEASREQGDLVTLVISLPGGAQERLSLNIGVTVAYVKLMVEKAHQISMAKQTLKVNGKPLIDPLSLADCPGMRPGAEVFVEVVVS